mmetsp:Transcript_1402/g.1597  ORF Transcript_1402/g.1597 Transcript_1402/m.1597 type:complete len:548 (-) Transcript_1402:2854-4497(-)
MFGIELGDDIIKLALKKNRLKIEETVLMLTSDAVENLAKELADLEEQKAFVPIIDNEPTNENNADEHEESKLNLILSNKSEYFDLLFDLLNLGVNEINTQAWNLLTQTPVNKTLYANIKNLDIKDKKDWDTLMDPHNMYKLLYSLQIINSLICSPDTESVGNSELQERYEWRLRFLQLGGFDHLSSILNNQTNIEELLKMQRRARSQKKKRKAEDSGKGPLKAGLYLINIIKIFLQASLLSVSTEDTLIHSIISQSTTSPFMKKLGSQLQGSSLNTKNLVIDISDGSKDNSSHNTPNFASPKSSNNPPPLIDNFTTAGHGFEAAGSKSVQNAQPKHSGTICTQVEDFQNLITQVRGDMSTRIIDSVNFEKLVHKIMSIIYYAVRTNDVTDKNINILIDLCFDLMLPLIVWSPDTLIPVFYRFHSAESFIVSSLRFRGDECIRKSISKAFRLICNNFCVNSKHAKEEFKSVPTAKQAPESERPKTPEEESKLAAKSGDAAVASYEDPRVYFLKVLLKNLPTGSNKSEKCDELFNLLTTLVRMAPHLFS